MDGEGGDELWEHTLSQRGELKRVKWPHKALFDFLRNYSLRYCLLCNITYFSIALALKEQVHHSL